MKIIKKQPVSSNCFVCGVNNPVSLKIVFYETDDEEIVSTFTLSENYQGFDNRVHSGIVSAILDEAISRSIRIFEENCIGISVEFKLNILKRVPFDQELKVLSRTTTNTKLIFEGTGEILDGDNVLATAYGKYMKVLDEDFSSQKSPHDKWIKEELTYDEIRSFDDK